MANIPYPSGRQAFATKQINWVSDAISVVLLKSSYVYNAAHDFLNDIAAGHRIVAVGLTGKTASGGVLFAANAVTAAVAAGSTVERLVIYLNTGNEATSTLIMHMDHASDGTPIFKQTNGSAITLNWHPNGIAQI